MHYLRPDKFPHVYDSTKKKLLKSAYVLIGFLLKEELQKVITLENTSKKSSPGTKSPKLPQKPLCPWKGLRKSLRSKNVFHKNLVFPRFFFFF